MSITTNRPDQAYQVYEELSEPEYNRFLNKFFESLAALMKGAAKTRSTERTRVGECELRSPTGSSTLA